MKSRKRRHIRSNLHADSKAAKEAYKDKRNRAKSIARKVQGESWNRFVSRIEHDLHGE